MKSKTTLRREEMLALEWRLYKEKDTLTKDEKHLINLRIMELNIQPYSRAWRAGYISTLQEAQRLLKAKIEEVQHG